MYSTRYSCYPIHVFLTMNPFWILELPSQVQLSHFNALGSDFALNGAIAALFLLAMLMLIPCCVSPFHLQPHQRMNRWHKHCPSTALYVWCSTCLLQLSLSHLKVVTIADPMILNRFKSYRSRSALTLLLSLLILLFCPTQRMLLNVGMRVWIACFLTSFAGLGKQVNVWDAISLDTSIQFTRIM